VAKKHVSKKALQKAFHLKGNARGGSKGCTTKCYGKTSYSEKHHGNYRMNGYLEIKGDSSKSKHYKPSKARLAAFPRRKELQTGLKKKTWLLPKDPDSAGGWGFGEEKSRGGKKNYQNANVPFAHNYHHLCPWEGLSMEGSLTTEELKLLQKAEYNLNEGFNLIILPMRTRVAEILRMHTHPNNHRKYNEELKTAIREVKMALGGDPDLHLDDDTAKVMKDTLEIWEKAEFQKIIDSGHKKYPDHVNTHQPSDMLDAFVVAITS